ncbi:MAG: hypothetical protein ABEI57_07255 [Halapricum sp.]
MTVRYAVVCDDCPGYDPDPRYSRPTATWEADFHDDLIHQESGHAEVEEVSADAQM